MEACTRTMQCIQPLHQHRLQQERLGSGAWYECGGRAFLRRLGFSSDAGLRSDARRLSESRQRWAVQTASRRCGPRSGRGAAVMSICWCLPALHAHGHNLQSEKQISDDMERCNHLCHFFIYYIGPTLYIFSTTIEALKKYLYSLWT